MIVMTSYVTINDPRTTLGDITKYVQFHLYFPYRQLSQII